MLWVDVSALSVGNKFFRFIRYFCGNASPAAWKTANLHVFSLRMTLTLTLAFRADGKRCFLATSHGFKGRSTIYDTADSARLWFTATGDWAALGA